MLRGFKIGIWFVVLNFVINSIVTEPVWYWWILEIFCWVTAIIMVDNDNK